MKCPNCGNEDLKVLDTRESNGGLEIKRRRFCQECGSRFLTHETFDDYLLIVEKKNGTKERFSQDKILKSVMKALEDQNISNNDIDKLVEKITQKVSSNYVTNINTDFISQIIMEELKEVSEIGYLQYVIHSKHITTINELESEISKL